MSAANLIEQAVAEGVGLAIAQDDINTLKVLGNPQTVDRWLPILRDHKAAILKVLLATSAWSGDLTAIRSWLAFIGENDPAIISEVLQRCEHDSEAHQYFLQRAAEEVWPSQVATTKP